MDGFPTESGVHSAPPSAEREGIPREHSDYSKPPTAVRIRHSRGAERAGLEMGPGPAAPRPIVLPRRRPAAYLCGPADLEQVEPVGVPVVDDVGQFPPLLLPVARHAAPSLRASLDEFVYLKK